MKLYDNKNSLETKQKIIDSVRKIRYNKAIRKV